LCDIVVYRQAQAITGNNGFVINNFSGIGNYIELASGEALNTLSIEIVPGC
jgi:hypothetical protein